MRKDINDQPGEEVLRARSEGILNAGASVPVERGAPPSLYRDVFDNLEAPPNPLLRGFYGGFITEV